MTLRPVRKRIIVKHSSEELPKDSARTIDTASMSISSHSSRGEWGKRVSFNSVEVKEYPIRVGDNPSPREGPPLTIGWEPQKFKIFSIDYFEANRKSRRHREELIIPSEARIQLLHRNGYSSRAIDKAMREAEKIRLSRQQSISNMQWDFVSAAKESIGRKLKVGAIFKKLNKEKDLLSSKGKSSMITSSA